MTAFLSQLAGMALGRSTPSAAHVVLPPRFALPALPPVLEEWPPDGDPAVAADDLPSTAGHPLQFPRREANHQDDAPPGRVPESKPAPAVRQEIAPHPARSDTEVPQQRHPHAAAPTARDMPRPSRRDGLAIPRHAASKAVATARSEAAAAPEIVVLPVTSPVAPMLRRDPLPLSDAALASRVCTLRETPPVVHVTIDCIDVRAPEVSKPAAPLKPARRQPAISLADYLRNGTHGGRA
jgi:hypothetical protein